MRGHERLSERVSKAWLASLAWRAWLEDGATDDEAWLLLGAKRRNT